MSEENENYEGEEVEAAAEESAPEPAEEVAAEAAAAEPAELSEDAAAMIAELDEELEKFREQNRWSDVIKTILAKADLHVDPVEKVALYREAGTLYIERSSNQAEAIKCFEKVIEHEPHDLEAIMRLKEMYEKRRDWESLIAIMGTEAELLDPMDRPIRYVEMAELATQRVRKPDICIGLWERVLEVEPTHPQALESLAQLYERAKSHEPLARVLETLVEADPDPKQLQKLGMLYADKLGDDEGAIRAFSRLLEVSPGDRRAQEQLKRRYVALKRWDELELFYGEQNKWDELIRVLERQADNKDADPEERTTLLFRAAQLWMTQLGKPDRAARAYEKILGADPDNQDAAEALSPIYEQAGDARRLAPVYEVRLRGDLEPEARVALLRETGLLYEERLRKADTAYEKYVEAFLVMPTESIVREDAERMATATRKWEPLLEAYGKAIEDISDPDAKVELRMAFGHLLQKTEQTENAIAQFRAVYDQEPEHHEAIAILSDLYQQTNKYTELLEIAERRLELESDPSTRRLLAYQRAELIVEHLDDTDRAISAYNDILGEYGFEESEAFRALDELYEKTERWDDLAQTLEKRIELAESPEETAAHKFRLGRVNEQHLDLKPVAIEQYREVLTILPEHEGARGALAALMQDEEVGVDAATILEPVYQMSGDWQSLIGALRVLHDGSDDPERRIDLLRKIAEIRGEYLEDSEGAFGSYAEALEEQPGNEDVLARLEAIAISEGRFPQLVELLARLGEKAEEPELRRSLWLKAATIQDTQIEDVEGAVGSYRQILNDDPTDQEVLLALDSLFRRTERWSDLVGVLRMRAEQNGDPMEQEELLLQVGGIQDQFLEDADSAISTYNEALEVEPSSARALSALDDLYARQERWTELADNVSRQLDLAETDANRTYLMLRLAELRETRMESPEAAIDIYRDVLEGNPTDETALTNLERLLQVPAHQTVVAEILEPVYRDSQQVQKLINVHEIQASKASSPERRVELLHRIGELYELSLDDYASAFSSYSRALAEDPSNLASQEQLERLSPILGDAQSLATTYEEQVQDVEDPVLGASLYMKAAQIREEQLQDFPKAIEHYQKVLELDEESLEAATSLERLFQMTERYEELAQIHLKKSTMLHNPDEQRDHLHRGAAIYEELLERPEEAIRVYHQALEIDPEDVTSLDKLIELNLRLEKWEPLLQVYNQKADIVFEPEEKKRLLTEVGAVYEQELNDDAKAIDSYQRILEIDPGDFTALQRLDQLYLRTNAHEELLSVLEREADLVDDPSEVISFRYRIADLWHKQLGDAPRANLSSSSSRHQPTLDALESMVSEGLEPVAAAGVLEPIYQQTGEWPKLVAVHEVQIAHEEDPLQKVELLHRVADLHEMQLDSPDKAFEAFARSLPADNMNEMTLASLERLAEFTENGWANVTDIYDQEITKLKEEGSQDVVDLALRNAQIFEVHRGDVNAAIERYQLVGEAEPAHEGSVQALDRLYEATEQWPQLAETLRREIDLMGDPDEVLSLQYRLGRVCQEHLGETDEAITQYEQILSATPDHQPAIQALESLFSEGVSPLKIGEILDPLYRMQENWEALLNVQEVRLAHQEDAFERVTMIHQIAELAEERANDHGRAFLWMQRALFEEPMHDHSLAESERLSSMLDGWSQLASTYSDVIQVTENNEAKVALGKRLARVYEEELNDVARAEEAHRFVIHVDESATESLEALDRMYLEFGSHDALAEVLKKRIAAADDPIELVDLNYRLGEVLSRDLGRTEEAIAVYDHLLGELEPEHGESVTALQNIYTRSENWPKLAEALEKELDVVFGDEQQSAILAKMAMLASSQLGDQEKAIELWRRVLELRGEDPEALNALGNIYAARQEWPELVEVLDREVNSIDDDEMRIRIYSDLARLWLERLEREGNALDNLERILDINPAHFESLYRIAEIHRAGNQEHELVDTLHRIVDVGAATMQDNELEAVYLQLGHLYFRQLEQPADAVDAFNQVLTLNPGNFEAMDALEHIHRAEGTWEPAINVMNTRAHAFQDPNQKIAEWHKVASAWATEGGRPDGGTDAYQQILEVDQSNQVAFDRLEVLHTDAMRWEELIEMYITRVESTEDLDESVNLLGRVAKVYEDQLGEKEDAYDALQVAWSLNYADKPTVEELTRVTRITNKWNDLLSAANEALQETTDQEEKITLCLQCARWYGQELDRPDYALPYYQQVQAVDPGNVHLMVSMSGLYEKTQQWDKLAQTYGQIVTSTADPDIQAETYVKMGDLSRTHLGVPAQAPSYYQKAIEAQPTNLAGLSALERIHTENQNWPSLVQILEQKTVALEGDVEEANNARLKLAEVCEDRTQNVNRAIEVYSSVLQHDGQNLMALKGLERLYGRTEQWQNLRQVLEAQYDVVTSEKDRVGVLMQLAAMWEEEFLKPDQAASKLEQVLEIDPMHEGALNGLARLYRNTQQWDKLLDTYERHVSATPDRGERVRIQKALGQTYAADLNDPDRAIDAYLNALSIDDTDVEALDALTRIYDKQGDHASALDMMEQLARLVHEPQHQVDLLFRSGRILDQELGDSITALDKFQMALDIEPGHLPSLAAMRKIQVDVGDYLAVAKLLEQEATYQENPRQVAELLVELGQVYDERLGERERAVSVWEAALQQDADNEGAAFPLSQEYLEHERFEEAFPLLDMLSKRAGKREPDEQHQLAYQLGDTALKLGRNEDAIRAYEGAYKIDSTHLPTLQGVAGSHYAAQDWAKAFKYYQMLLVHHRDALAPDEETDTFYRLGVIKREQGERRKALNMFDKALEVDGYHRPTLEAIIGLYEAQQEWQQVIHFKRQLLDTVDDVDERFELLDQVGSLWSEKVGHPQRAIEAWSEASDLKPDEHRILHKLLGAYQETRDWENAIGIIDQVAALDDRKKVKAKYAYTVGVILRDELKDADQAMDRFHAALKFDIGQLKAFEAINKILTQRKDWPGLEQAYRRMIKRASEQNADGELKYNLFYTLGIIYRDRLQNYQDAAAAFTTAAQFKPDDPKQHQILAELYSAMPEAIDKAIAEHQWLLKNDPFRVDSYRALYRLYFDARAYDKAWCLAAALVFLQKADTDQQQFHQQYKPQGPIRPTGRVERNLWFNELFHPDENRYVSKIMELMAPAVLQVKSASDKALNLHKLKPQDIDPNNTSSPTFARTFGFVHQFLGIPTTPRLYMQQQSPGGLAHIAGSNPPSVICGATLLSGYGIQDLQFVIGRFLNFYLSEHFVRTLFNSHSELRMLLLAALRLSGQGAPDPQVDQWAQMLQPAMNPATLDGLRTVVRKFLEDQGGRADIKEWMKAVELTGTRAGFLVCNDLEIARRMIQALPPDGSVDLPPKDKIKDLVLFSVSENYFRLREALGIQISV